MRREGGPEREASRENDAGSPEDMVETLMAFDKDHDGKLSKAELPERMQGMFDRADTNHDGFLTPDEIRALAKAQAADAEPPEPRRVDPLAALLDTNHDGVISAAEIDNAPAVLRTLDKNGDGQLTQDELRPFPGRGRGNRDANGAGNQGPPIARLFPFDRLAFDQSRTAPQQTSGPAAPPERQ
jgi:Ca2+-binding EF-hand superfamily protein